MLVLLGSLINDDIVVQAACCGAESSHIRDIKGNIYSTGWNEHGNLAIGSVGEVSDENIFHNMDGLKCEENIEEK